VGNATLGTCKTTCNTSY